jgi:hypothetical protein
MNIGVSIIALLHHDFVSLLLIVHGYVRPERHDPIPIHRMRHIGVQRSSPVNNAIPDGGESALQRSRFLA